MSTWTREDLAVLMNEAMQMSLYCEHCQVVPVQSNERYCEGCTQDMVDAMALEAQEQIALEQGLY